MSPAAVSATLPEDTTDGGRGPWASSRRASCRCPAGPPWPFCSSFRPWRRPRSWGWSRQELALLLGGVLASQGRVPLAAALAVGTAGALAGDSAGYWIGRRWGPGCSPPDSAAGLGRPGCTGWSRCCCGAAGPWWSAAAPPGPGSCSRAWPACSACATGPSPSGPGSRPACGRWRMSWSATPPGPGGGVHLLWPGRHRPGGGRGRRPGRGPGCWAAAPPGRQGRGLPTASTAARPAAAGRSCAAALSSGGSQLGPRPPVRAGGGQAGGQQVPGRLQVAGQGGLGGDRPRAGPAVEQGGQRRGRVGRHPVVAPLAGAGVEGVVAEQPVPCRASRSTASIRKSASVSVMK